MNEMKLNLKMIDSRERNERTNDRLTNTQFNATRVVVRRDAKTNRRIQTHRTMRE